MDNKKYLKKNNFYTYLTDGKQISKSFQEEYRKVSKPSNKRNLQINKSWEKITSFGEPRKIIVLDLGGTNLNISEVEVKNNNKVEITKAASISFYKNKIYTPNILFTDLKKELDKFTKEKTSLQNLVFIFSYPIEQITRKDGYIDAICKEITKEHKHKGLIGIQVGIKFQNYLRKNGYPKVNISVTNDTIIHALAAKGYELSKNKKYDAAINIIVGTGCNISAVHNENKGLRIINTEFGNFKNRSLSNFDSKGIRHNEKMISGTYQHQIFKKIINDLLKNKLISKKTVTNFNFHKMDSAKIEKNLKNKRNILKFIWQEINNRGSTICGLFLAIIMSELLKKLKKTKIKVLVIETGSVIKNNTGFKKTLLKTLKNKVSKKITYNFINYPHQEVYGAVIFDTFSKKK